MSGRCTEYVACTSLSSSVHKHTELPAVCIPLYRLHYPTSQCFVIDLQDLETVSRYHWHSFPCPDGQVYVSRRVMVNRHLTWIFLHRSLLGLDASNPLKADHINGVGIDNRRHNLRKVTQAQNLQNKRPKRGSSSSYRGVYWNEKTHKWVAQVVVNYLGVFRKSFPTELEAAEAAHLARLEHMPYTVEDRVFPSKS